MSIIRVAKNSENPYVMINKTALNDEKLSFKAKGIFAYLMSKPNNWKCQVTDLQKNAKDGKDSIYSGIKELRKHGYMIKRAIKNEKNIITEWEEILYEVPQEEAKKIYKEQKIINERAALKRAETIKNKNKESPHSGNPEVGKSTSGKSTSGKSVSGKSASGKPANIIINDSSNIDLSNNYEEEEATVIAIENFEKVKDKKVTIKEKQLITELVNLYSINLVIKAIEVMAERAERITIKYIRTTLEDWKSKNLTTVEAVNEYLAKWEATKQEANKSREKSIKNRAKNKSGNGKMDSFNDRKQRDYSDMGGLEAIEKKLLGWDK